MPVYIESFGCEFVLVAKKEVLGDASFVDDVRAFFDVEPSDFAETEKDGVLVATSMKDRRLCGFWENGTLPYRIDVFLSRILESCEDGSFVEFLNSDDGAWETFRKEDGAVVADFALAAPPENMRPRAWKKWVD